MDGLKKTLFWIFHIIMKIFPAAIAFILAGSGLAEDFSGAFYNIYLLAGYLFIAFAVGSCFIDYKLIQKDMKNGGSDGVKKILIIDGIVFLLAIALFVYYAAQCSYMYGMGFWEFVKEFNFFYWLGAK
ncbi:MAG: hypothetical protein K2K44_06970 [Oscillospiraceae bacterium]|nr:hypothetical protein [Oscillospiraceae bacterium]